MPVERPFPPSSGDAARENSARDVVGALNAVVGFAQLLAVDDGRLAPDQRARYTEYIRDGARLLLRHAPTALGLEAGVSSSREAESGTHAVTKDASLPPALDQAEMRSHAPAADELEAAANPARVFIVDQDVRSRELVAAFLEGRGYDIRLVESMEGARSLAEGTPPDLVVLDAADVDAFATARTLKARDEYVSVVFVTPIGDNGARLRALEAGAEQFLEKPVGRHETRARVRNLLNLRRNQRAMAEKNVELKRLQAFKDEMAALMVHDLKSPLSAIAMNLDVALSSLPEEASTDDVRAALEDCRVASARLFRMIANLLDISRSEDGRLVARTAPVDLRYLVAKIVQEHLTEAKLRHVRLVCDVKTIGAFELDPDLLGRVIENLIENGLRYTRPGGVLKVIGKDLADALELRVANDGPPIPVDARVQIFEKYGQATAGATRVNRGLGLYFCRVAAEAHGGGIDLCEEPGMTTCFRVMLARRPCL